MRTLTQDETHWASGGDKEISAGLFGAAIGAVVGFHSGFLQAVLGTAFALCMPQPYWGGVIISGSNLLASIASNALIGGTLGFSLVSIANYVVYGDFIIR